ncbi:MAG TPA: EpsI family protein [Bryobacteraceae bacterium]|nr:EpsI family protein [Bryobacteraceae bacterium]
MTVALVSQAILSYGFTRHEILPANKPLAEVPTQIGDYRMVQEGVVEKEVMDVLRADEVLTRSYARMGGAAAPHLFVAYFRTQRAGQAPHSPKNCLPGSGWVQEVADTHQVAVPGRDPITVNRYIVAKGENRSLVMYWYQSRDRVVASEYSAKFYVVADAIRYNRTDTALVRVTVPIINGQADAAQQEADEFVRQSFGTVRKHFPA